VIELIDKIKKKIEDMRNKDTELINKNKATIKEADEIVETIIEETKVKENDYETENKLLKGIQKTFQILSFGAIAISMFYMQNIRTPDNKTLTTWLTLSIMTNIMILFLSLFTGIGTQLVKRFYNKFRYKSGKFVNDIFIMKSGVIKEVFVKKDELTGSFRMAGKPYVTNAKLMFSYKGIPTYMHREDNPDPVNVWQEGYARELSCSEMDTVMASMDSFNAIEWLKEHKNYLAIGLAIIIMIAGFSANMLNTQHKAIMETGDYKEPKGGVTCKMIVPVQQAKDQALTVVQGDLNNNATNQLQQDNLRG